MFFLIYIAICINRCNTYRIGAFFICFQANSETIPCLSPPFIIHRQDVLTKDKFFNRRVFINSSAFKRRIQGSGKIIIPSFIRQSKNLMSKFLQRISIFVLGIVFVRIVNSMEHKPEIQFAIIIIKSLARTNSRDSTYPGTPLFRGIYPAFRLWQYCFAIL